MGATLAPDKNKAAFAIAKATPTDCNGLAARTIPDSPLFEWHPMQRANSDATRKLNEAKKNGALEPESNLSSNAASHVAKLLF